MNISHILLILSILIEPFVWLYAIKIKFQPQYQKMFYLAYIVLDIVVSSINEFSSISEKIGDLFFALLFFVYTTGFICIMFEGKMIKKILHIAILFIMSLASDFIVFMLMLLCGADMQQLSGTGIHNAIARIVSKIVMYLLVRGVFKKVRVDSILLPFIALAIVLELPTISMFRLIKNKPVHLIGYVISQITAVSIIAYIVKIFRKKRIESEQATEKLEAKAAKYRNRAKSLQEEAGELRIRAEQLEIEANEAKTMAAELVIQKEALESRLSSDTPSMLEFFENRKKIIFNTDEIIYFERVNRKVIIKSKDGRHEVNATILSLEKQLGERFVKLNQGTLVNRTYIQKTDGELCYLKDGTKFHIARERAKIIDL